MYKTIRLIASLVFFVAILSVPRQALAQDPVFSQFHASPMQLNPAFAGTTNAPRVALNYRNQWSSIFNAYVTYAASYEQFLPKLNSGFGFTALVDEAGDGLYNQSRFSAVYSYNLTLTKGLYLKGGIDVGVRQVSVDWDRLVFLDQLDPINGQTQITEESRPAQLSTSNLDLGAGFLVYGKQFYAGFSAQHLNTPSESFFDSNDNIVDGIPMRFTIHGGAEFSLSKNNNTKFPAFISPSFIFTTQREFKQINLGSYIGFGPISGGVWYRHTFSNPDAVIFGVGYRQGIFKIGYSYDWTVSALQESNGSHEISLVLNFDKNRRKQVDYNDCFKLFR